ncbi:MAG: transcriptional repressor [Candidatus Aminicenantes bacterium]|nr:MAG: transcriptional repressor [Candidatus Aminicenantes bacterium]
MRAFLESKAVKPSYQRLKILEYLMKNQDHPSVDTIFQALCDEIPTLSKTTVYNTLSLFAEKGIAHSLTIVNNELRYDLMKESHAHFQCWECNRVFDIPIDNDLLFTSSIEEHRVEEIQVTFKGVCKNCLKIKITLDKIS